MAQLVQFFFDRVENIWGKGENAGYQHFLQFPQCSQKVSFPKVINSLPNNKILDWSKLKTADNKINVTSSFSFSHCVFYPLRELSAIFMEFRIVVCKLFQFGIVQNLSFGKGLIVEIPFIGILRCLCSLWIKIRPHKMCSQVFDYCYSLFTIGKSLLYNEMIQLVYLILFIIKQNQTSKYKLKAFAEDRIDLIMKLKFGFGVVENIMGKGENAGHQYSLLFSHYVFEKLSSSGSFNSFPNKPWFLRVCSTSLLKTLREKEKLLVTTSFSFSHSVF